ncbi:hypothetical protein NP493_1962g00006 [Ridgeia piscesae]|uniref:Aquaporin-3 n=1 Tax=Ridgeia piscesae TaxID=27915 RepID=A0AAD9N5L8_RIDPI|nr:hypothetical protein NP493_1962g00006 [Ridgeia piscesae]
MSEGRYARFSALVGSRLKIRNILTRYALAECLGTFLLVIFCDGCAAQSVLTKHAFGNIMTIHIASGIALAMAVYAAGGVTGGHVNPSITLTMCILGRTPWRHLPVYWLGQYTGSFLAAVVLYGEYYDALNAYDGGVRVVFGINGTAGLWTTFSAEFVSVGNGFFDQIVCTALLLMCVLSIFDPKNMNPSNGLIPIALGAMFTTLGMSFGVNFGYAVNPARDLAPRVFVAIAGWGTHVFRYFVISCDIAFVYHRNGTYIYIYLVINWKNLVTHLTIVTVSNVMMSGFVFKHRYLRVISSFTGLNVSSSPAST